MSKWQVIHEETLEGFDVVVSVTPEEDNPRDHFAYEDEKDNEEIIRRISEGSLEWFAVRVQAFKKGVLLGEDYLGACCYERVSDFIQPAPSYYNDMVGEAIDQAQRTLKELLEEVTHA